MTGPRITAAFILERLEVIGDSAPERATGNEMYDRMLAYLASHRSGNEEEIRRALSFWIEGKLEPKLSLARLLLKKLKL
jgi:hypothetical protein